MKKNQNLICQVGVPPSPSWGTITITSFFIVIFFALPIKGMCKLGTFLVLENKEWNSMHVIFAGTTLLVIVSALVSFIVYKTNQYLRGKGGNINFKEFIYIFILSIIVSSFFILAGLSLGYCILLGSLIPPILSSSFYCLQEDYSWRVYGSKNIMGYLMSENNSNPNPNPNDNTNSDTERSSSGSSSPSTESVNLNKSLKEIELHLELVDKEINFLQGSIPREIALQKKLHICSKILSYMPVNGVALSQVFHEASLNYKNEVLVNRVKLDENQVKFRELMSKRIEVLERLEEI